MSFEGRLDLEARIEYAITLFVVSPFNSEEADWLASGASNKAFVVGALHRDRVDVPPLLADVPYLAEAFRMGQVEGANEFGFVSDGQWVTHDQVCQRCKSVDGVDGICVACWPLYQQEIREAIFAVVDECWNDYSLRDGYDQ
jgi:hypothetical protein